MNKELKNVLDSFNEPSVDKDLDIEVEIDETYTHKDKVFLCVEDESELRKILED